MKPRMPELPPWVLLVAIAVLLVTIVVLLQGTADRGAPVDAGSPLSSARDKPI